MLKRISLFFVISLHILTWGVTSEASLAATPRAHFSLAELFTPSTYRVSAFSVFKSLGGLFSVNYSKGAATRRSANCPPCPTCPECPHCETCDSVSPPAPLYKIGDFAEGGVVIWLTEDGQHGLVAAITDAGGPLEAYAWGPNQPIGLGVQNNQSLPFSTPNIPYGQYYGGYQNQTNSTITNNLANFPAFQAAENYAGGDYTDWWLPSSTELSLMYTIREKINQVSGDNGGTALRDTFYWSSRESGDDSDLAWNLNFFNGDQGNRNKVNIYAVRCVRAF
jgi:hypothetical protein